MSDMLGLSVDSMTQLITTFTTQKEALTGIISQVESQVQGVQWQGTDANNFKSNEWPDSKGKLTAVITSFDTVVGALNKQLAAQQDTSGS